MKIRLSEEEVYEIKLPEEIGISDFQAITSKFNFLLKNFVKFDIGGETRLNSNEGITINPKIPKKQDKKKWKFLRDNREVYLEILKAHYLEPIEKYNEIVEKYGITFDKSLLSSGMGVVLREFHKIKPQEVGLSAFPTRKIPVDKLRLDKEKTK